VTRVCAGWRASTELAYIASFRRGLLREILTTTDESEVPAFDHDRLTHQAKRSGPIHLPLAPQALLESAMIRSRSALCLSSGSSTGCIPSPVEALVATSTSRTNLPCYSRRLLTSAVGQGAARRLRSAASPAARFSSAQRFIQRKNKSSTAIDFTQSSSSTPTSSIGSLSSVGSAAPAGSVVLPVPQPTPQALRTLFVASAIPMVGFGFMVRAMLRRLV
jgi:hypothetical protein